MDNIGYGYGSEWHLMRFMARHRDLLEKTIKNKIGNGDIHWLDFGFDASFAGDSELKGLSFPLDKIRKNNMMTIPEATMHSIEKEYISGWKRTQSWDAVFVSDNTIYLVEAKARVNELKKTDSNAGDESRRKILSLFKKYLPGIDEAKCFGDYYQFANRIATAALLCSNGINSKCLYIYFEDGFEKTGDNQNAKKDDFVKAIRMEREALRIKEDVLDKYLVEIFINAKTGESL
ncbi:MAG: hypothetical protein IKR25_13765 [Muribaculaceae bacterium]|nr:hypothetical protein [Muribaculaceae bacterium]